MSEAKRTLIDECERLVAELENEMLGADSFELFEMVKKGLEADVQPNEVVEQIENHYIFGERLSWEDR